ncbi:hypothetical protein NRI58_003490 [Vibrio parahaemolyticus]|nr:hypothetical protein [Vibrio parahaemolyticus]ELB2263784.1 hypothetical protein [Vibrio parahaemolyticus]
MRQHTQIEAHLLNSSGLLRHLESIPFSTKVGEDELEHELFLSFHRSNLYQPDHILKAKLSELKETTVRNGGAIGPVLAIKRIVDQYIENRSGCSIKLNMFEHWQNLMARISSLQVQAYFSALNSNTSVGPIEYRWPLYPFHPSVEDYISQHQLHESHQHLNGSSNAETCWLDAIQQPSVTTAKFKAEFGNNAKLRQLCAQICPELTPDVLRRRLELADYIRNLLAKIVCSGAPNDTRFRLDFLEYAKGYELPLNNCTPNELSHYKDKMKDLWVSWPTKSPYSPHSEFNLFKEVFRRVITHSEHQPFVERLLWIYLLIQNQYLSLLVQRDDFYGFDQFQKYTFTELRDFTEQEYVTRFRQAHGDGKKSQTGYLEGRLAPKKDLKKFESLLTTILNGYAQYLEVKDESDYISLSKVLSLLNKAKITQDKAKLALVIHFIKKKSGKFEHFPFKELYEQLEKQASILIHLIKAQPDLAHWLRGIDAAANEMDTPPEVFAPLFRVLKNQGINHITYHVGEDFPHLISGIRAIDDALRFLPLSNGDRLGHCTAIGITPKVWRRSIPPILTVNKETHLLDLIFIWRALRHNHMMLKWANLAASNAVSLAHQIFGIREFLCIEQLDELFSLRDIYPLYAPLQDENEWYLRASTVWDSEYKNIDCLLKDPQKQELLGYYRRWLFCKEIRLRRNEMCSVKTEWLPDDVLVALQQYTMKKVVDKNLAIECPPSSNIRISQYVDVQEHHVFRWMGLAGYALEGDAAMSVCLASDDPGIFVTDLRAEFYHLFSILTQRMKLAPHQAITHLSKLNENGRVYRFHSRD